MRLTLASLLCACLAIYCNYSSVVLSLPPSLIANAAALRQQQHHQQPSLWKKDARILFDGNTDTGTGTVSSSNSGISGDARRLIADILPASSNNALLLPVREGKPPTITLHNKMQLEQQQQQHQQQQPQQLQHQQQSAQTNVADFNRKRLKEYDLDAMLAGAAVNANVDVDDAAAGNDDVAAVADDEADADAVAPTDLATFGNVAGDVSGRQSKPQEITPQVRALDTLKYFTPFKYWSRHCQTAKNCPSEYYRAMLAARSKAAALHRLQRLAAAAAAVEAVTDSALDSVRHTDTDTDTDVSADDDDDDDDDMMMKKEEEEEKEEHKDDINDAGDDFYDEDINNEIFMLLSGEQDLIQFLHWAMELLYPYSSYTNLSEHATAPYYPGMFIWKKLNLSGHLEAPLVVEEPHYVLVRRENLKDDFQLNDYKNSNDDPFIPPRGRKHNSANLDALLRRYETFVPNRGKRDQIKDIFKYDDLFYPNRGKKNNLDILKTLNDPFFPNRGKKQRDIYNVDDPFFPNRGKRKTASSGIGSGSSWSVNDVAGGMQQRNVADEDRHLTWLNGVAGAPTQLPRIFGKLKRKLQLVRRQQQQRHVANEIRRNEHDDVDDDDNNSNNNGNNNDYDNNDDADDDDEDISSNNNEWPQRMSTHKINGYDQSVKPSMSATATMLTTATSATASDQPTTITTTTMRHPSRIVDQRAHRSAGGLRAIATAARLAAAANRLHSTRSMSTNSQLQRQQQSLQQQQQRQRQHYKQLQRQSRFSRHQQQQQQQQIHHKRQLSPQVQQNLRFFTKHHQVKSNNDLEPLFWRQQQLQRSQPWQKEAASGMQQHQQLQLPPETQLSPRFAAVDIDTDYDNFET